MLRPLARVLILAGFALLSLPSASAYAYQAAYPNDRWCSSPSLYNDVADSTYRLTTDVGRALWNDIPMSITLGVGSAGVNQIYVGQYSNAGGDEYAHEWMDIAPVNGCFQHSHVEYNLAWNKVHGDVTYHLFRTCHELGHSLDMEHVSSQSDIMYPDTTPNSLYHINYPTADAILGVVAKHGSYYSTFSTVASVGSSGDTPTNYPARIWSNLPGNNYILAYNAWGVLSSTKGILATGEVTANTLYRYSLGFHSSTDPRGASTRPATIEVDNDGIRFVATAAGSGQVVNMLNSVPATGQTYFLEVVMPRIGPSNTFYAEGAAWFVNPDGSIGQFFGAAYHPQSDIGFGNPPATMYIGQAAWTDNFANSDYNLAKANGYVT